MVTNAGEGLLEVVPGMHTPMGLLWIDDELYVSSIEGITVFRGFDGSRFAEEETILTFPGGGVAGSIVLGVDGRLRVGISAPCNACEPESRWAAAVVSFLPDGSGAGDRGERHPRGRGTRLHPGDKRPPGDDEPAR
ncbi:MAG: hypothetical protein IPN07_03210 [Dehalococcoidia bacterium]|nr:hypothetical protein [Dehalococcoidia bacterium]